ncbi:MAG TPA: MFS transporter [Acidimicrobiia bacterium]|nr:MFS transporter [Acidimicrobiia bacterium]
MSESVRRLVRRYYTYAGLYTLASSLIWGVNALFLLDAGLSVSEVFIANAAWSAGTTLFEIPTGVVADTIGRRASFLLSLAVLALTTLAYVGLAQIGAGLVAFVVVSVLIGLGFTFYSGAMEAWLVDGVQSLGYGGEMDRIFSRGQVVSGAAMLTGTVGGGLLGQIDLAIPFLVRSLLLSALFVLAFVGMHDLGFEPKRLGWRDVPGEAAAIGRAGIRFGWSDRSLRLLMLTTAAQMGLFAWAWYAWQPYFLELLERDVVWVAGVVAALLAISMMVGNGLVEVVTRWCGRRSTLFLWSAGVYSLALIGVGLASSFALALSLLCIGSVAIGLQSPVRQAFIHKIVPTDQRATVISFDSMVTGGGSVAGQTGLGYLAERQGFSTGYVVCGAITLTALPFLTLVRRIGDEADYFVGRRPGFACAAPGVPAISQVDADVPIEHVPSG